MARLHELPPDTNQDEKAIGGILTFVQAFWILGGAVLGLFSYLLIYIITRVQFISIFFGIIIALTGLPFAFFKKKEMTLFKYLRLKSKFKKKNKKLINRRFFN